MATTDGGDDHLPIADLNLRSAGPSMEALAAKIVSLLREGTVQLVDLAQGVADMTNIRVVGLRATTGDERHGQGSDA